ncbi:YeeE/YedE family protein [Methylobacterium sp. C25]|uniref:YeeE/YedE family protein n=1 Tax=Methylobacterium sp. C25 TaxID=2721622 RepID=UPI001F47E6EC|nr:YeeE/YedE family protein [Methylobacterium sp. C25]MCE4226471.1 YeeE/YedE family protein [Methylobacterium sp. C25]
MSAFVYPLVGGLLIGASAVLLLLGIGRIAGISGIASGMLSPYGRDTPWRAVFLVGLLLGPLLYRMQAGHWPEVQSDASLPVLIVAGLLVGYGTRLGSGCTSGHGVCGLARLSPRSVTAVAVFMVAAAATVFIVRHRSG